MIKKGKIKMIKRIIVASLIVLSIIGIMPVSASAAWKEDSYKNRSWIENGVAVKGWKKIDSNWYNFNNDGKMQKGWLMDGQNWYYFWSDGTMAYSTWLTNGGFWYYFDADGKMVSDSITVLNRKYDFKAPAIIISQDVANAAKANDAVTNNN